MKQILLLAAAVALAACHSSNPDQAGPAPAPASTTDSAVTHVIDSTRTGPPGTQGRSGQGTVTPDSVGIPDSAARVDTTMQSPGPTSAPQDTLGPQGLDSATTDTTGAR